MKKWLQTTLVRFFKDLVADLVKRALEMAVLDLEAEIDDSFESRAERDTLKSGVKMLRSKVHKEIEERLERI